MSSRVLDVGWCNGGISNSRIYFAYATKGSVAKAMLERRQFDSWAKGNVVSRVAMPLNFGQRDIACGTKMGNPTKRIRLKFQSNQIPNRKKMTIGPHLWVSRKASSTRPFA